MAESFWWHLLAGFTIGFILSTLWEWLYFRRRRMVLRNQRIAELEAQLQTYVHATHVLTPEAVHLDDWDEPRFEPLPVYLESEEPFQPTEPQPTEPLPAETTTAAPIKETAAAQVAALPQAQHSLAFDSAPLRWSTPAAIGIPEFSHPTLSPPTERMGMQELPAPPTNGSPRPRHIQPEQPAAQNHMDPQRASSANPPEPSGVYVTQIQGRTEWLLVRLVQTLVQFVRQVRSLLNRPSPPPPSPDELTQLRGLTEVHAQRLRSGGITTLAQLANLSVAELQQLTPGDTLAHYRRWLADAATLTAAKALPNG
jgi:hypothetical protein